MKNRLDIIKNDIQLYNCIKKKFNENVKIELCFKLDDKDFSEVYFYQSIDTRTWQIIFTSDDYKIDYLHRLFIDIELLLKNNMYHLDEIIEKHIDDYFDM